MQSLTGRICCLCNTIRYVNIRKTFHTASVVCVGNQRGTYDKKKQIDLYKRRIKQGPEPERHRSVWANWNYDSELYSFGKRLGEEFKKDTIRRVFTHRSYIESEEKKHEQLDLDASVVAVEHTDNTEFIEQGEEAIVSFIRACLRHQFPAMPEDCIRSVCSYLTSDAMLAYVGTHIGVTDLALTEEFPATTETLSKTFKAVVGGLIHDQGLDRSHRFIQDFVLTQLIGKDINEVLGITNPMGLLAGVLATLGRAEPEPRLMYQAGASTMLAVYMVGIYCDKELLGKSYGETVTIAEEMAARDALRDLFGTQLHRTPIKHQQPIELHDTNFKANISIGQILEQGKLKTREEQKQIES